MERSTAEIIVKIWAVLAWIGAFFLVIGALGLFFVSSLGGMGMMGTDLLGGAALGALGMFGGVLMLAFAALEVFVGIGLWGYKNWARIVTIVFSVLSVLSIFGGNFIGAIIGALGVWLFGFEPTVKGLFGAAPASKKKQ